MNLSINDNNFNCKVVSTPEKIRTGMMFKTFDGFEGMLFIMPEDTIQSFWMKNCVIPLDIVFISNGVIEDISPNCPPCVDDDCPSYQGKGGMILEIPGGTCRKKRIRIGDKVDYQL
jgi:uncharacterized membrane protein (UPF0127 family)